MQLMQCNSVYVVNYTGQQNLVFLNVADSLTP